MLPLPRLQVTTDPLEADFILAHGTEALGQPDGAPAVDASLDGMRALMRRCAERRLPMVVANPDLVSVGWRLPGFVTASWVVPADLSKLRTASPERAPTYFSLFSPLLTTPLQARSCSID